MMSETRTMGVVARPEKTNYLRHLAAVDGKPAWETRMVRTLCGQRFYSGGYVERRQRIGSGLDARTRRDCQRCKRKAARHLPTESQGGES